MRMPRITVAALTATTAITAATGIPASQAGADPTQPIPLNPDNPVVAEQWINPAIRPEEGQQARVELLSAPGALNAHDPLTLKIRVTNTSTESLTGLSITPRRGPATGSVLDQRIATVANPLEYEVAGQPVDVGTQLEPGQSTELEITLTEDEFPLPGVTTYPLMLVLSSENGELLDTERFHTSIRGTSDGVETTTMTTLFPISAPVDIVPGETGTAPEEAPLVLASEQLADQLTPEGRLSSLIDVFADATTDPAVSASTCLALDPAVVHTVARMARGYTVADSRPDLVEPPQRLRDSWGRQKSPGAGETGRGMNDAQAWLDTVSQLAATQCVIALPWANANLNAVARTGDVWLMRETIERGPTTLAQDLGTAGITNAVIPAAGYLAPGVADSLGWADHSRSMIATEGMQGAWERSHAMASVEGSGPANAESTDALDRGEMPSIAGSAAPQPNQTVRVLVAENTVETGVAQEPATADEPNPGQRFAWAAPGVMTVSYQDSLATVLATVGEHPDTTGYSNPQLRFDFTQDSTTARSVNAASAIHLAAQNSWRSPDQPEAEPILVNPPATWDAASAADVMGAVRDVMATAAARPLSLEDYLNPGADPAAVPPAISVDTPYPDPSIYSDTEILAASQQGRFTDELSGLLANDPAIALTRYGFTLPLRRDILFSFSMNGRRSLTQFAAATEATRQRLARSRDTLNALRAAIALIPPGNVYTRTSPSSPLVIVARNGLPLPVDATIRYTGPQDARLNVPSSLRIPAYGSVTVSMTADLPTSTNGTELKLFLAAAQGGQISQPVDITVRTSGVALSGWFILAALATFLALLLLVTAVRRRKRPPPHRAEDDRTP